MKQICTRCRVSKTIKSFLPNFKTCFSCRAYGKTYERNDKRRQRNSKRYKERYDIRKQYLLGHPCVDCGNSDPRVLEFDHVRGKKLFNISALISTGVSIQKLSKEIEKCEVRCANCHLIRHYNIKFSEPRVGLEPTSST